MSKAWHRKAFCLDKNNPCTFKRTWICGLAISNKVIPVYDLLTSVAQNQLIKESLVDVRLTLGIAAERTYRGARTGPYMEDMC